MTTARQANNEILSRLTATFCRCTTIINSIFQSKRSPPFHLKTNDLEGFRGSIGTAASVLDAFLATVRSRGLRVCLFFRLLVICRRIMLRSIPCLRCRWLLAGWLTFYLGTVYAQDAADGTANRRPAAALPVNDAELAIKRFQVAPGLKVDLWAAEPLLANPVAFNFDEQGRAYVCETFRLHAGVDDIRGIMDWLDEELAARTVDDRLAEMKRHLGDRMSNYVQHSERVRLLEDRAGTGKADHATVFAEGFNTPLDGIGAGV